MLLARRLMTGVCVGVATKVSNPFRPGQPAVLDVHELIHAHELRVPTAGVDNAAMIPGDGVAMPIRPELRPLYPRTVAGSGKDRPRHAARRGSGPAAPPVHRTDLEGQQRVDSGHLTISQNSPIFGPKSEDVPDYLLAHLATPAPPPHMFPTSRRHHGLRRSSAARNPDAEILAAIRPAMASVPGSMLLCASSPYARKGVLWSAYRRHFGKPGSALVWQANARTINPTISQGLIDEAIEADPANAAAEFNAQFRVDVETYVSREVVEAAVVSGH